ncbi:unnamed protein product [Prunus armeniaca]|uniref:Uncharacterized protein n=1 Tax=Prunus armeniaca TaxID=36596 RepID=A0A6J5VFF4_PRUAR|nr:unnamed protein product [Prunus armeniaca]
MYLRIYMNWLDGFYGCTVTLTSMGYGMRKKKLCPSSLRQSQEVLEVDGEPPVSQQAPPFPLSIALPRLQQFGIGITISKQEGKSGLLLSGTRKKKLCPSSLRQSQEVDGEPPVSQQAPQFPLSIAVSNIMRTSMLVRWLHQKGWYINIVLARIGVIFLVGFGVVAIRFIEAIAG